MEPETQLNLEVNDFLNALVLYLQQRDPAFQDVFNAHLSHILATRTEGETDDQSGTSES